MTTEPTKKEKKRFRKLRARQQYRFKHRMEVVRTCCSAGAFMMNLIVILHLFKVL